MTDARPEGYERLRAPPDYGEACGPVGLNPATHKLGFCVAKHHLNPASVCHGGALSTFADRQILAVTGDVADGERVARSPRLERASTQVRVAKAAVETRPQTSVCG